MKRFRLRTLPRRLLWILGITILSICAAFTLWVLYLDRVVTSEFRGRLWSVPARVYAEPIELYAGTNIGSDDLEQELRRLHYRPGDPAVGPGFYRRRGGEFDLNARRVRFADELRAPMRVRVHAIADSISGVSAADGSELPLFRLDPLLVGSVFPVHGEDRIVLAPDEVSPLLRAAIKTIEDRRFDEHHGVDLRSIMRAMWANLRAGRIAQGGSTLTQQLVKNYFLSDEQTFGRKAKEAVMALRLEARYTKEEILVAYLNEVYLGQDGERAVHGFGLGSEYFFGKPVDELEVNELALLVGLVKGPSYYDPHKHPDRARARRNLVLKELADERVIDAATAAEASAQPLGLRTTVGGYVPAFLDLVRRHLKRDYAEADLSAAGLSIFTTLDPRAQAAAERSLTRELKRLDASSRIRSSHLEAAVVIAEPQSGDVVAVVGGREIGSSGFNRALDAHRPIGSLVKPAVYLAAMESGRYTAASLIEDAPISLKLGDGSLWEPQNYTHEVFGTVPLVRALSESMNLATVRLGLEVGLDKVADTLQRLGLEKKLALNPSLLLGAVELTPLEVVQVYTALANGGFQARLRSVQVVLDEHGMPLKSFKLEVTPAASPAAVYQVDRMMAQVTERGTGRAVGARFGGHLTVPAKTGTSSDLRDSWFAGFTGNHVAVVWVGYDDNRPTGLTGAMGALPIWLGAMADLKPTSWEMAVPSEVEDRWIEFGSGLETRAGCSADAVLIAVPRGTTLPARSGCATQPPDSPSVVDRVKQWLEKSLR
ncbi:MAG: penicillin-binding protein 1B [Proteobacteria bacterium]|nr:penicillin-binding protein 1B [Pseudomonadota bacterium]